MMAMNQALIATGNQPPCVSLLRLAARKPRSTIRKPRTNSTVGKLPHCRRIAAKNSTLVTAIVPVTAMP
jgi:hypothetical protein